MHSLKTLFMSNINNQNKLKLIQIIWKVMLLLAELHFPLETTCISLWIEFVTAVAQRLKPSRTTAVLHGRSTTWFQTLHYCRAKVELDLINWVQHDCSTTFEMGHTVLFWKLLYEPHDSSFFINISGLIWLLFINNNESFAFECS